MTESPEHHLVNQRVTYTLQKDGRFFVIENVPARVDEQTGERFFAPATVAKLQQTILGTAAPKRVTQTPVFTFSE